MKTLLFLLFFSAYSHSIVPKNKKAISKLKKQSPGLISNKVYKFIERSHDLASQKKYNAAIDTLKNQVAQPYIKQGEQAQMLRSLGFIYLQKEATPLAIDYLQQSLASQKLSYSLHMQTLFSIAQITIVSGNYKKGEELLKTWFSLSEKQRPEAYILYAICLLEQKQNKEALKYVEKTISMVRQPQESWLKFALSFYLNNKDYKKARPTLEKLVAQFPTRSSYWKQLAGVYIHLNNNKKALITLELAYKMGHLNKESQYLNLVKLLIEENNPYQAAKILQINMDNKKIKENIKNLELMADAYAISRERQISLSVFSKIFETSKSQKMYSKYGFLLLREEKWKKAAAVFKKSLTLKKELPKLDKIYLGLGISLFYQNKFEESLSSFRKSFEINSEQSAAFYWIQHAEKSLENHLTKNSKI